MGSFHSSLVGVTFHDRQRRLTYLQSGQKLFWKHDKGNMYDENAIIVFADAEMKEVDLGHIRRDLAAKMMENVRKGSCTYDIFVEKVTGGNGRNYGVNLTIFRNELKREGG